jgi:hypothetical protein
LQQGKLIKIRGFPKDHKVKLFRVTVSTNRTEFVTTNDLSQASTDAVQDVCGIRWKPIGVSPRAEAVNWSRSLSVSQSSDSTKSYCLCPVGLESSQTDHLSNRQNDLSD